MRRHKIVVRDYNDTEAPENAILLLPYDGWMMDALHSATNGFSTILLYHTL